MLDEYCQTPLPSLFLLLILTPQISAIQAEYPPPGDPDQLVFPARMTNKPHSMISLYYKLVGKLFNEGIADKKLWVNSHILRHTFASWLVEKNTNIYLVKDLLGHSDLKLTERMNLSWFQYRNLDLD